MNENKEKKFGDRNSLILWGVVLILITAAVSLLIVMVVTLTKDSQQKKTLEPIDAAMQPEETKTELHIFQKLSQMNVTDENNQKTDIMETAGVKVIVYWASWCTHCKEVMVNIDSFAEWVKSANASLFIVNKLDGEKETKEQALNFLQENNIQTQTVFDVDCENYETVGLHMIPTVLVVDGHDRVTGMKEGMIPAQEELEVMIREALTGKSGMLAQAIEKHLMNEAGGIGTNYEDNDVIPSGEDVLSESQGIMMEYAANAENMALFGQLWDYVEAYQYEIGLMPWVVSKKETTNVNALVDDFRIALALGMAAEIDTNYEKAYENYVNAIYTYNTEDGMPIDLYDYSTGEKSNRFTLCYGDLKAMQKFQEKDKRFEGIYEEALQSILSGRISEKFPLYYSYFDYAKGKYEGDILNMSEALTTLLHLAQVGELPKDAWMWLENRMEEGVIYAAYDLEGKPVKERYYESTAVYSLIAMIALEYGREDIAGKAINKAEQQRIVESSSRFVGLFGNPDGSGIYSFDQGMALLAYEQYERVTQ